MSGLILDLVGARIGGGKLRHVSMIKGGEWCSPCPVCGGDDRFRVWPFQEGGEVAAKANVPGTWWCRHCEKTGDAISLLMFADGLSFTAACKELQIELSGSGRQLKPLRLPKPQQGWQPTSWAIPTEKWRKQATKLAQEANTALLAFPQGLSYLAGRGIPEAAVRQYGLGFLQGEDKKTGTCLYRARASFDLPVKQNADGTHAKHQVLWIPRGITIPLWPDGQHTEVHRVRIRRPKGDLKEGDSTYMMLNGSGQAPMLLPPVGVPAHLAVWVVVEAELDAIAVHHACGGKIGVMASLTNLGKPDVVAHKFFSASPLILVALDLDAMDKKGKRPGYQGWLWWQEHYAQTKRWPVPEGKDPGDSFRAGYKLDAWVDAALPAPLSIFRMPAGKMGDETLACRCQGEGVAEQKAIEVSVSDMEEWRPRRWEYVSDQTPLHDAHLPEGCPPVEYLHTTLVGKAVSDDLLVACPKGANPWWWRYYRNCQKCMGHNLCIVDFLTSPQMLGA